MKKLLFAVVVFTALPACKDNEEEKDSISILPAKSFIQNQVAHVDTSLYRIVLLTYADSTVDTSYVKREDFRKLADEFFQMPDLTEKKFRNKYEKTENFDPQLGLALFSYSPKKGGMEIIRQEISVEPLEGQDSKVKTVYVERITETKDSSVLNKLYWQMDEYFQVIKIVQKKDHPEKITRYKVAWN
jgi:hypothetical protein